MTIFEGNRDLLDGFRGGDPAALTEVYLHYVDRVALVVRRGFALSGAGRVPGAADAETERELVQEVFLRAFSAKARLAYDGLRPYRPYLLRIAMNLLIDRCRRQGRDVPLEDVEGALDLADWKNEGDQPEEALDWRERVKATREYLLGLDPALRELVRLRFEQELSQYEVMERLKLSRWRVRSLEKKVQDGLVKHLKRKGLFAR